MTFSILLLVYLYFFDKIKPLFRNKYILTGSFEYTFDANSEKWK